jgi:hypothetical protein
MEWFIYTYGLDVLIKRINELCVSRERVFIKEVVAPTVEQWFPNPTVVGSNPIDLIF